MDTIDKALIEGLKDKACEIRKKILTLGHLGGALHFGGDLSMTDAMVALFYYALKKDPKNPHWPGRDRFILSKGHGAGCLYTVLADCGYFSEELLRSNYNKLDSGFGIHPIMNKVPGVEASTGSLGHGLSLCVGMGIAAKLNHETFRIYCLLGDGECQEGSVWEAAMSANHYKLGNLTAIIDRNGLSLDGPTEEIMALEPLEDKWKAFGWNAVTIEGNDMEQLLRCLSSLPPVKSEKPTCIIAKTTKGKGICFMENDPNWHAGSVDSEKLAECCVMLDEARKKEVFGY